jgi:hypothetical protein
MQEADIEFKISTLRRRQHHLLGKLEGNDSSNARRFDQMEVEALAEGIKSMERLPEFGDVKQAFVKLLTAIETGGDEELVSAVSRSHEVIDKYRF